LDFTPEQIEGGRLDGRTDQYALACMAFECLTGSTLFADRDAQMAGGCRLTCAKIPAPS